MHSLGCLQKEWPLITAQEVSYVSNKHLAFLKIYYFTQSTIKTKSNFVEYIFWLYFAFNLLLGLLYNFTIAA
jgi:hypothetical protein